MERRLAAILAADMVGYSQKDLTLRRTGLSKVHDETYKGEEDMTKAKARQRAKAKAAQKARKREANADRPGQKIQPGQFDRGTNSIKGPGKNVNTKTFSAVNRGASRSR